MIDILISGIINAVADAALDELGQLVDADTESATVDIQPVVDALARLSEQTDELINVLRRPAETAGAERSDHAAIALSHGWYGDALDDAEASIGAYRYRATPHLIAAVASVQLGQGDRAMRHFSDAVKYAAAGEPEIGAVAALAGASLATAVKGRNYAIRLLTMANDNMGGRCPPLIAALSNLGAQGNLSRLISLWWTERGREVRASVPNWRQPLQGVGNLSGPYPFGGQKLQAAIRPIVENVKALEVAERRLQGQVDDLAAHIRTYQPDRVAAGRVLEDRFGIRTPSMMARPFAPSYLIWGAGRLAVPGSVPERMRDFGYESLPEVRRYLDAVHTSSLFLLDIFECDLGESRPRSAFRSQNRVGPEAKAILTRLSSRQFSALSGVNALHLKDLLRSTREWAKAMKRAADLSDGTAVVEVMSLRNEYEALTKVIKLAEPVPLSVTSWLPVLPALEP